MKQTKSDIGIALLRKDMANLTEKEFEARYPGVKREVLERLSDREIEKIAGSYLTGADPGTIVFYPKR